MAYLFHSCTKSILLNFSQGYSCMGAHLRVCGNVSHFVDQTFSQSTKF